MRATYVDKLKVGRVALPNGIAQNGVIADDDGKKRALVALIQSKRLSKGIKLILRGKANLSVRTKLALEKASVNFVPMVAKEQLGMSVRLERLHGMQRLDRDPDMVQGHLAGRQHCERRDAIHVLHGERDGRWRVRDHCGEEEAQGERHITVEVQLAAADGGRREGLGD